MKSTVEVLDDDKVKLSVEVDAEEFEVEVDKAFRKIARDIRLPGFRKGKVPRKVLEARFGSGLARGQALEDSIPDYFLTALSESEVDMIGPPDYEITAGEEDGDLAFEAVVAVRPHVEIDGYHGLQVEIPSPEPSSEEMEARIESFLSQFGELESVDRPAIGDDTVTMDITTTHEGDEVEGLTAGDYSYRVGTGGLVAELDENLMGAKVGDILQFDADHPDPEEGGKLDFRILVKDVQVLALPELSDELVADATEFDNVVDFRADIDQSLRTAKQAQMHVLWREKAVAALGELIDVQPPESLVDSEVRQRINDMAMRLAGSGIEFETYLQMVGQSIDDVLEQTREPATEAVRVDMALRALAAAEDLEPTDDDVDAEFETLAEGTGASVEDLREQISTPNQLMLLRADIAKRKAADWLLDNVDVVDEHGNPVDTEALEPEPDEPDHPHDHDHPDDHDHLHDHDHADEEE